MEVDFVKRIIYSVFIAQPFIHVERISGNLRNGIRNVEFVNGIFAFFIRRKLLFKRTINYFVARGVSQYAFRIFTVVFGKRRINLTVALADYIYFFKCMQLRERRSLVGNFVKSCGKIKHFQSGTTRNRRRIESKAYEFLFALGHSESDFGKVLTINESLFRHFGDAGGYDYFGEPRLIEVTRTESRNAVRYRIRAGKYRRSRDEFRLAGYLVVIEQRSVDRHISGVGNGRSPCGSVNRIRLYLRTTVECSRRDERYGIGYVDLNQIFEILESIFADRNDLFTVVRGGYGQFGEF